MVPQTNQVDIINEASVWHGPRRPWSAEKCSEMLRTDDRAFDWLLRLPWHPRAARAWHVHMAAPGTHGRYRCAYRRLQAHLSLYFRANPLVFLNMVTSLSAQTLYIFTHCNNRNNDSSITLCTHKEDGKPTKDVNLWHVVVVFGKGRETWLKKRCQTV